MKCGVIFLPGGNQHWLDQSVEVVAERLAAALKHAAALQDVRVSVKSGALPLGEVSARTVQIEGRIAGQWRPLIDIFDVNYIEVFVRGFSGQSSIERVLSAASTLWHSKGQASHILRARNKGLIGEMQLLWLAISIAMLAGYLCYWIIIAIPAGLGLTAILHASEKSAKTSGLWAIGVGVVVGALLPVLRVAVSDAFKKFERSAVEQYTLSQYLQDNRPFGTCHALVRRAAAELRRQGYDRVDVVSYSLGSIIAGDTFYPRFPGLSDTRERVEEWVTIGYPYDVIRTALPDYFRKRGRPAFEVGRWFNVTGANDYLGSKFRDDQRAEAPAPCSGIFFEGGQARPMQNVFFPSTAEETAEGLRRRSWKGVRPLRRIRKHLLYWDDCDPLAPSCFAGLFEAGYLKDLVELLRCPKQSDGL
jgi:hypothetical protein